LRLALEVHEASKGSKDKQAVVIIILEKDIVDARAEQEQVLKWQTLLKNKMANVEYVCQDLETDLTATALELADILGSQSEQTRAMDERNSIDLSAARRLAEQDCEIPDLRKQIVEVRAAHQKDVQELKAVYETRETLQRRHAEQARNCGSRD